MHLRFGNCVVYITIYRLTERKQRFHVQNRPCGTVVAKMDYVLGLIVHGKVVVEIGRKVFLVDWLLWKNIKYDENMHNRTRSSVFMNRKTPIVTIQGNNCDEVSKWRHSVGSSSYMCQTRYDVGTGIRIMSRS